MLGKKTDLRLHARIVQFHAQNTSAATAREDETHKNFQGRSFARAIRSQETEELALFHRQVKRRQRSFWPLAPEANAVSLF